MQTTTIYGYEANKIFAWFLKQVGILEPKFRKIKVGYRTLKGEWLFNINQKIITQTKKIKEFNGYDYDERYEEVLYKIVKEDNKVSIKVLSSKIY